MKRRFEDAEGNVFESYDNVFVLIDDWERVDNIVYVLNNGKEPNEEYRRVTTLNERTYPDFGGVDNITVDPLYAIALFEDGQFMGCV